MLEGSPAVSEQARASGSAGRTHRWGLDLRPRMRVFAAFFLYAFCMGGIYPRMTDLQRAMDVAEGALGMALIGTAVGTLASLSFAGRVIERVGYRASLLTLIPVLALAFAIAALAQGPVALFLLLLPAGLCIGAIEIIVNLEADRVEHDSGERVMNRAHAFWSMGFFAAGMFGAGMAQAGISPAVHMLALVPLVCLATLLLLGRYEPAPHRTGSHAASASRVARPTMAIMVLVAVALSALLMEGAGSDWAAIYMRDVFGASPLLAGIAVAVGAFTQAIARFFADGFVERFNPVRVARVLLTILGAGGLLVFAAESHWVALAGLALIGLGSSAIFPLAMSAAAQRTDRPAATNVAALAQISFVAFLAGPPLLGIVAEHWGVRWSFGVVLPFVLLSFAAASSLRPVRTRT